MSAVPFTAALYCTTNVWPVRWLPKLGARLPVLGVANADGQMKQRISATDHLLTPVSTAAKFHLSTVNQ